LNCPSLFTTTFWKLFYFCHQVNWVTSQKTWILLHKTHLQWTVGYAVVSWLRHCTTSRKVAGSIPNGFIGIFHWHNPSSCTMAVELTQPLTQMSTRNISLGVKVAGAWGWQPHHLPVPTVLKSGSLNLLELSGPVQAHNGIVVPCSVKICADGNLHTPKCCPSSS
jgi:hypothetical protein